MKKMKEGWDSFWKNMSKEKVRMIRPRRKRMLNIWDQFLLGHNTHSCAFRNNS